MKSGCCLAAVGAANVTSARLHTSDVDDCFARLLFGRERQRELERELDREKDLQKERARQLRADNEAPDTDAEEEPWRWRPYSAR